MMMTMHHLSLLVSVSCGDGGDGEMMMPMVALRQRWQRRKYDFGKMTMMLAAAR